MAYRKEKKCHSLFQWKNNADLVVHIKFVERQYFDDEERYTFIKKWTNTFRDEIRKKLFVLQRWWLSLSFVNFLFFESVVMYGREEFVLFVNEGFFIVHFKCAHQASLCKRISVTNETKRLIATSSKEDEETKGNNNRLNTDTQIAKIFFLTCINSREVRAHVAMQSVEGSAMDCY